MVTIVDFKPRTNDTTGEEFFALILAGDIEMIQSQTTGRFYATARRASIPSTFNETVCESLIGKQLPGTIVKVDAEAYEFTLPETGEIISLTHRYEYQPDNAMEREVFGHKPVTNHQMVEA